MNLRSIKSWLIRKKIQDQQKRINSKIKTMKPVILARGEIEIPNEYIKTSSQISTIVDEILSEYTSKLTDIKKSNAPGKTISRGALNQSLELKRNHVIQKINETLEFESTPQVASEIIQKLESHPEIESITQLSLKKIGSDKIKVALVIEAWSTDKKSRKR